MLNGKQDITVLNGLIATTIDSADGYREAVRDQETGRFAALFQKRASERDVIANTLKERVTALGGTPEDDGTVLAGMDRMFTRLKAASTKGDTALVDAVEQGEDYILEKFESAIRDNEISGETAIIVRNACERVREGHDEMRDIKHDLHA